MQAEEVQKELEEVKTKNAAAEQTSQSDAVALRERVESAEKERDDVTFRLGAAEAERNDASKKVKELEQRSRELHERLITATEVSRVALTDMSDEWQISSEGMWNVVTIHCVFKRPFFIELLKYVQISRDVRGLARPEQKFGLSRPGPKPTTVWSDPTQPAA